MARGLLNDHEANMQRRLFISSILAAAAAPATALADLAPSAPLSVSVGYEMWPMPSADVEFLELQRWQIEEISRVFMVPRELLSQGRA